jgi:hypothetical protein
MLFVPERRRREHREPAYWSVRSDDEVGGFPSAIRAERSGAITTA